MCGDYRDLNRANLKDDFPLPHIDVLVDNTTNHALLSFMDWYADPLRFFFKKPALNRRLSRWLVILAEFDLKYLPRKSIKGSAVSDVLADCPIEAEEEDCDLPDKQIRITSDDRWSLHSDAEYEACMMGLEAAIALGVQKLRVCGDSSLIINQISEKWKVRSESLALYQSYLENLVEQAEEL
ncbi:uncharacterized protein [Spinacia oleracea]|uniref:RNase H type-1 domain-containing protein n=1 Tax=Spinacia oleracea TaxID=3562 RepID=A0ABM3RI63_SPIOL|nr:uncharacterized protein LOC130469824 [Spinacia oleracea]